MPRATIQRDETYRYELRTCPGGYVTLRKLSYYEMMQRQDIAGKIIYENRSGNRSQRRGRAQQDEVRSMLEMSSSAVMEFEFKNCIVEHNLTDENDQLLDFRNALTFQNLDGKIGGEIADLIDALNQPEEEDLDPSITAATSSSQNNGTQQNENTEPTSLGSVPTGSELQE